MANNDEAGGSGLPLRSLQLTYGEADVLYWQRIPVPLHFKLPHGWHLSNAGYAVPPPPPPGPETRALVQERRARMTPAERALPDNALNSPTWPRRFQQERDHELARMAGPNAGRFNNGGRRTWWSGRDVDDVLAYYGHRTRDREDGQRWPIYFPQATTMAPPAPQLQRPPPRALAPTAAANSRAGSSSSTSAAAVAEEEPGAAVAEERGVTPPLLIPSRGGGGRGE